MRLEHLRPLVQFILDAEVVHIVLHKTGFYQLMQTFESHIFPCECHTIFLLLFVSFNFSFIIIIISTTSVMEIIIRVSCVEYPMYTI